MHSDFSNVLYKTAVTGQHMWDRWWESSSGMGLFFCNYHRPFSLTILPLLLNNVHLFISIYLLLLPSTLQSVRRHSADVFDSDY